MRGYRLTAVWLELHLTGVRDLTSV
jgi:hypothetical protein